MQDFQAFTVKFSARTNVLFSNVGVSLAFNFGEQKENRPPINETKAIWDTGASCTVISKQFAKEIGLVPTGKTTITGVNHTSEENTYLVNVYLPNRVCLMFVKIAEAPALSGGAGMLIGMDVIGSGDFSVYSEEGKTVMTYRYPSIGGTDFVVLAGNIRSHNATKEKIETEKRKRQPISKKTKLKRKLKRKNAKKNKPKKR